ncbi:MAG TPA: hypothetical protein VGD84_09235 [Pseudonocardiaceae bacterium]
MLADSAGLLKLGKGALKGLPYVGTGATLIFGGIEVADGSKTLGQAAAETGLSLAGGLPAEWPVRRSRCGRQRGADNRHGCRRRHRRDHRKRHRFVGRRQGR